MSTSMKAGLPGRRAGGCIVERRAVGLTLPGSLNSRRRVVPAALGVGPDRPSRQSSERGCAPGRQSLSTPYRGTCARAWRLRSRMTGLHDGVLAMLGVEKMHRLGRSRVLTISASR
jgi:hypothetical protein